MQCPNCKTLMVKILSTEHQNEDIFERIDEFPKYIAHTISHNYRCFKCRIEVIQPEIKYYYPENERIKRTRKL